MAGKKRREIQEINGGPMADIAFLLLIFFLVATTISTDSGLYRKLPPMPKEKQETEDKIKKRNVLPVLVNKNNDLLVKNERMDIRNLATKVKEFMQNPYNEEDLPEKKTKNVPYFGEYEVTKGIISLQNDRGTSYGMYIMVQNELTRAINELRDELAMQQFNKKFDELEQSKQEAINEIYPLAISEAEPKNVGGD
jgi:biopolymer transport protein ExbD